MTGGTAGNRRPSGAPIGDQHRQFAEETGEAPRSCRRPPRLGDGGGDDLFSNDAADELMAKRGLRTPFFRVLPGRPHARRRRVLQHRAGSALPSVISSATIACCGCSPTGRRSSCKGLHRAVGGRSSTSPVKARHPISAPGPGQRLCRRRRARASARITTSTTSSSFRSPARSGGGSGRPSSACAAAPSRGSNVALPSPRPGGETALEVTMSPGDGSICPAAISMPRPRWARSAHYVTIGIHAWTHDHHLLERLITYAVARLADDPVHRSPCRSQPTQATPTACPRPTSSPSASD